MAKYCSNCGRSLNGDEKFCANCGTPVKETPPPPPTSLTVPPAPLTPPPSQVVVKNYGSTSNGVGCAGFGFALIGIFSSFIPFVNFLTPIFAGLGLLLSFIGLFSRPRGLAIAGLIVSIIAFIVLLIFAASIAAMASV